VVVCCQPVLWLLLLTQPRLLLQDVLLLHSL
jgi:hypothetical protein